MVNDSRDIPELLKVTKLVKNGVGWPVHCRVPQDISEKFGVLRGVHPEIPLENIKESVIRNGALVKSVDRIINRNGPTYCVKLSFTDNKIPNRVYYDGVQKTIHHYYPPLKTLICNNCSRPDHKADNCKSKPRCPKCSRSHNFWGCPIRDDEKESMKCPNCSGAHSAKDPICAEFQKAKNITNIKFRERIPYHAAKNVWTQREQDRTNENRNTEQSAQGNSTITTNTGFWSTSVASTSSSQTVQDLETSFPALPTNLRTQHQETEIRSRKVKMINAETQTSLTVSDISTELVPKSAGTITAEAASGFASIFLDFIDIQQNTEMDQDSRKNKIMESISENFGVDLIVKDPSEKNAPSPANKQNGILSKLISVKDSFTKKICK